MALACVLAFAFVLTFLAAVAALAKSGLRRLPADLIFGSRGGGRAVAPRKQTTEEQGLAPPRPRGAGEDSTGEESSKWSSTGSILLTNRWGMLAPPTVMRNCSQGGYQS